MWMLGEDSSYLCTRKWSLIRHWIFLDLGLLSSRTVRSTFLLVYKPQGVWCFVIVARIDWGNHESRRTQRTLSFSPPWALLCICVQWARDSKCVNSSARLDFPESAHTGLLNWCRMWGEGEGSKYKYQKSFYWLCGLMKVLLWNYLWMIFLWLGYAIWVKQ